MQILVFYIKTRLFSYISFIVCIEGGDVHEVFAKMKFNPTTETVHVLWLCLDSTSAATSTAPTTAVCDCPSETSSSYFYSSEPEGFILRFSSNGASSSSSEVPAITDYPFMATTTRPSSNKGIN